jgi:hypothetical protein
MAHGFGSAELLVVEELLWENFFACVVLEELWDRTV